MRLRGAYVRHQCILRVSVARGIDAQQPPRHRLRAIRRDKERAAQLATVLQSDPGAACIDVDALQPRLDQHCAGGPGLAQALSLQRIALDDVAQIGLTEFRTVEAERALALRGAAGVPYAHALVGKDALRRHTIPYAAVAQQALGGATERKYPQPPVCIRGGIGRQPIGNDAHFARRA